MSTLLFVGSIATLAIAQATSSPPTSEAASVSAADSAASDGTGAPAARAKPPAERDLHFTFTPGVYLARLGGDVNFGPLPGAEDLNLEDDFDLDDMEPSFNMEMTITKGERWEIGASGFDFSTDAGGTFDLSGAFGDVTFDVGDAYETSFDMTSVALEVSYWQWHPIKSAQSGRTDLRFAYGAGIRWLSVEQHLELPGTDVASTGDGDWLVPAVIGQMSLHYDLDDHFPIFDAFEVLAYASIGPAIGGDGGVVGTLRAGIRGWFCNSGSIDFGYRLIDASVEHDDYEFNGGLQGLFISGTLRF